MSKARTRGHIARLVVAHGWQVLSSNPGGAYFRRGTTSINLRFGASGQLIQAIRYLPGMAEVPTKGRMAFVVGWLTEAPPPMPRCQKGGPDPYSECADELG